MLYGKNRNVSMIVVITGTDWPSRTVGVNSHCLTASRAGCLSNGGPSTTRALLTRPSASTRTSIVTTPWTWGWLSDRWIDHRDVLHLRRGSDTVSDSKSSLRSIDLRVNRRRCRCWRPGTDRLCVSGDGFR